MQSDNSSARFIAFIDVLGVRSALAIGRPDIADARISSLADIVTRTLRRYPSLHAHGATDCFVLWSQCGEPSFTIAAALSEILSMYFDLNDAADIRDIHRAYLLRAGLSFGNARLDEKRDGNVSHAFLFGDGLASAFEAQTQAPGMRIIVSRTAISKLNYNPKLKPSELPLVPIHKTIASGGNVESYEFQWAGPADAALSRLARASLLFDAALSEFRKSKRRMPERVVLQYQQTLCAILRCIDDLPSLLRYCSWRHKRVRYDTYYAAVWATAWLRLLRIVGKADRARLRSALRDKYIQIAGTRVAGVVSCELKRRGRWKSAKRILLGLD